MNHLPPMRTSPTPVTLTKVELNFATPIRECDPDNDPHAFSKLFERRPLGDMFLRHDNFKLLLDMLR